MNIVTIADIANSFDRHKIFLMQCESDDINSCIEICQKQNIYALNIGLELSSYISKLKNYKYLNIDVNEQIKKLIDKYKTQINSGSNHIIAIYNLGILFESELELNVTQLLQDISRSVAIIIIWDNYNLENNTLSWLSDNNPYTLQFSEIQIKKLHYEI